MIDGHLDLSWNATAYDRDQLATIEQLREHEKGRPGKSRGRNTVSLPQMRRANIGICLATVLARSRPSANPDQEPPRTDIDYTNPHCAYAVARGQLAYYELLEELGHLQQLFSVSDLKSLSDRWLNGEEAPIGYVLSMEGCDPIITPQQAGHWWDQGLRTACLAHYGPSAYAMGTGGDGPLTDTAAPLLAEFDRLGMILDLVHTADTAMAQALDLFGGPVFVSHGNCRALVDGDRQISDEQIKAVTARDGVIGVVLDAWMMTPGWVRLESTNDATTLAMIVDHIDHICQLAGSPNHAAIGSDLDGGFGTEQCPNDLDTIADLHKLEPILAERGYSDDDINGIFHGNWLRFLGESLPQE